MEISKERSGARTIWWPSNELINDQYEDDLTTDCISQIANFINTKKFKSILFVGCSGGGYNTYLLCKEIITLSCDDICITVIDRKQSKIETGNNALLEYNIFILSIVAKKHATLDNDFKNIKFFTVDFLDYQYDQLAKHDCVFCMLVGSFSNMEALKLLTAKSTTCKVYMTYAAARTLTLLVQVRYCINTLWLK